MRRKEIKSHFQRRQKFMKEFDLLECKTENNAVIHLFTIGFAGKSAQEFFEKLKNKQIKKIIDVRLNNVSQLAGFAKRKDLEYFLNAIAGINYRHDTALAPTKELLDNYKKKNGIGWDEYERLFNEILEQRGPQKNYKPEELNYSCLLCSEASAKHCHRRLVAEFFKKHWNVISITHL